MPTGNRVECSGQALHHALLTVFAAANELAVVKAACNALKRRIEQLEARESGLSYRGTWKQGVEYRRGDFVTDGLGVELLDSNDRPPPEVRPHGN